MKRIGFVGGGAIAEAIIKGLLKQGIESASIFVSDISTKRLEYLQDTLRIQTMTSNAALVGAADLIVLAVKPQNLAEAAGSLSGTMTREKILISVLAGVTTRQVEKLLPPGCRVIRAMPNTPALVGCGITVLAAGKNATDQDLAQAKEIFKTVGDVLVLPEKMMNAVTGLSGSGPAYLQLEALADGGVLWLPREALQLLKRSGRAPWLRKAACTPPVKGHGDISGGPSAALKLEQAGVRELSCKTVKTAAEKSEQMAEIKNRRVKFVSAYSIRAYRF